jgi:hypothetical protein
VRLDHVLLGEDQEPWMELTKLEDGADEDVLRATLTHHKMQLLWKGMTVAEVIGLLRKSASMQFTGAGGRDVIFKQLYYVPKNKIICAEIHTRSRSSGQQKRNEAYYIVGYPHATMATTEDHPTLTSMDEADQLPRSSEDIDLLKLLPFINIKA